ncbi:phage distal tail protein, Rcc01695 family [Glacieibacterium sp.]|uniref:phage distal tail protein, Rcc01695 family n=1 Tax=Glacieibacterium sp. TaxID=2860237 RepID=UPI003B008CB4
MGHWLATTADQQRRDWLKRFDARFWTVDFPRPVIAAVTTTGPRALRVDLAFLKADDLAGLIWASEDRWDHALTAYATDRDYRGCSLAFRWRSSGVMALDAVNGPVLTIEGRDAAGTARNWYVRLWNYATGAPDDCTIALDFDSLSGGFVLPGEADPVWAGDIDRMFVSMVPAGFTGIDVPLGVPQAGWVELSEMRCEGPRSCLEIGDTFVPPHRLRIATGYDDSYNITPARLLRGILHCGYGAVINHYVGMSHFPALAWDGAAYTAAAGICAPAAAWHASFLREAKALGFEVILSLSFELLDQHCPAAWKQRDADAAPALTGYTPPSTLLSPCSPVAMAWLQGIAAGFAALARAVGQRVRFQVGEPWWWVSQGNRLCAYDAATLAAYTAATGLAAPEIRDVRSMTTSAKRDFLDWLGVRLGAATLALRDAAAADETLLLFYAPQVLRPDRPDLIRANLPAAWTRPAFDVLQLEDYEFVTRGDFAGQGRTRAVGAALGYPLAAQHYFAGYAETAATAAADWPRIAEAAAGADAAETFVWAWPQVARDGFTTFDILGDETMPAFHDVRFPLELGYGATGGPQFSTQVVTTGSGYEQRNSGWADARLHYDAGVGVRSEADLATLIAFFRARRGQAHGFRFNDPLDHAGVAEALGSGDGVRTRFELVRTYGLGEDAQLRRITRPLPGSVRVLVDGVPATGWSLGVLGAVDFITAPVSGATVTASFDFDVPVRFAEDRIDVGLAAWRAGDLPSVPLVEVREA